MLAQQGHEHGGLNRLAGEAIAIWPDERDHLLEPTTDWQHQPTIRLQLIHQWHGHLRRSRGDDDRGERRLIGHAATAVARDDLDVIAQAQQSEPRLLSKLDRKSVV